MKINFLPSVTLPANHTVLTVADAVGQIQSGLYKAQIEPVRAIYAQKGNCEQYKRLKQKLPAFTFNGTFDGTIKNENFIETSRLFHFDIDHVEPEQMKAQLQAIFEKSLSFAFTSPSGKGVKGAVCIGPNLVKNDADFKRAFMFFDALLKEHGITIDSSCNDVRRLCYVSHDEQMFYNARPKPYPVKLPEPEPEPVREQIQQTDYIATHQDAAFCEREIRNLFLDAVPGNRHQIRLRAGMLAGGLVAAGRLTEAEAMAILLQESDRVSDKGTNKSEFKTLTDALAEGMKSPALKTPFEPSYTHNNHNGAKLADDLLKSHAKPNEPQKQNTILDNGIVYSQIDLLSRLPDSFLSKRLSAQIASSCDLPASTVFLNLMGIYSSMTCRKWAVNYPNGYSLPIGLFAVTEQPTGVGKSRCHKDLQKPFIDLKTEAKAEFKKRVHELEAKDPLEPDEAEELECLTSMKPSMFSRLFITNATPEALEDGLRRSGGYFAGISSEQGLFDSLLGLSYQGGANNNDIVLNGFDGGYISTARISRDGYSGPVVGAVCLFAQPGSIEKVIGQSKGTGLAERFLLLCEPHQLGKRDHTKRIYWDSALIDEYHNQCRFAQDVFNSPPTKPSDAHRLIISETGWRTINEYRNKIEPHLADGEKYSHHTIRGAASKIDMQIMKIAANLYLLERDDIGYNIPDNIVEAAILIADDLLQSTISLFRAKGLLGDVAEYDCILKLFENDARLRTERQIIQSRSKVTPFKELSGSKSERIRAVLHQMVADGVLYVRCSEGSIYHYGINQ